MRTEVVDRLVDEVLDYFEVGPVGLYEFIWILRSDPPSLPEGELRAHAQAALDRLLGEGRARLVWHLWGTVDYEREATPEEVDEHAWKDPTDKPYLALVSRPQLSNRSDGGGRRE